MKYLLFLILTTWISIISSAQVLHINKRTNLISVQDSITFNPSINQKDIEPIIYQWQNFISTKGEANNVFNYDGIRDYIELSFSSKFKPSLDVFAIEGKMRNFSFRKILGQLQPSGPYIFLSFTFRYTYKRNTFTYEFTNFQALNTTNQLATEKFENETVTNRAVFEKQFFTNNKKKWIEYKEIALERFHTIAKDFNNYLLNSFKEKNILAKDDLLTYSNYKKIPDEASYDFVSKLLGSEGKELSSVQQKENNKTVQIKTLIWKSLVNDNYIIISFKNDKLMNKSQSGL